MCTALVLYRLKVIFMVIWANISGLLAVSTGAMTLSTCDMSVMATSSPIEKEMT